MISKSLTITILLALAFGPVSKAQSLKIRLKDADTSLTRIPSRITNDTASLKNLPFKQYSNRSLRRMAYYNIQAMYENIQDNPGRKKAFREFVGRYQIDTTYVTKAKLAQNYIYMCTALDEAGKKHVILDADNDHDFSNDQEFIFDLNGVNHSLPVINAKITFFDGKSVKQADVMLQIDPYTTIFQDSYYKSDIEKKLDVTINILLKNKTGDAMVNNQGYKINISNFDKLHPKSPFNINIQKVPFNQKNNNDYIYQNTDTIEIAGNRYTAALSPGPGDLNLNFVKKTSNYGAETGTVAPEISLADIRTNKQFSLRAQKGRYVIADFWGSWCGPCIRLIPEVKKLYQAYNDQIQFVSIAFDKPADLPKLKKLINENDMSWTQLMDNKNQKNGVIDQFKINEFPTCLLIDDSGKVVYRGVGHEGLKDLIAYYNNITDRRR